MALLNRIRGRRGMSSLVKLILAGIAYRSLSKGKGKLAAIIGAGLGRAGFGGAFTGGATSALLVTALQELLESLRRNAQGPTASAQDIEKVLSEDGIQWLMRRTGMSRGELMAGLQRFARSAE